MGALKTFFLHKLTLRIIYIAGAFSTSHIVAFASSDVVQGMLASAGVLLKITDPDKLKFYLTGLFLTGGEIAYHFFHERIVIPHVTGVQSAEVKISQAPTTPPDPSSILGGTTK